MVILSIILVGVLLYLNAIKVRNNPNTNNNVNNKSNQTKSKYHKFYNIALPDYSKDNQFVDERNQTWSGTTLEYVDNEVSFNYLNYDKEFIDVFANEYADLPESDKIKYHGMYIDDDPEILDFIRGCYKFLHKSTQVKELNELLISMIKCGKINRSIISSVNHKAYIFVNPYGLYGQDQINMIDFFKRLPEIFKDKGPDILMRDHILQSSVSCLYDQEQRQDIDYIKTFPLAHKDLLDYNYNSDIDINDIKQITDEDIKYKLKIRYEYNKNDLLDKDLDIDEEVGYIDTGDIDLRLMKKTLLKH